MLKTAFCYAHGKMVVYLVNALPRLSGFFYCMHFLIIPHREVSSHLAWQCADCSPLEVLEAFDNIAKILRRQMGPHEIAQALTPARDRGGSRSVLYR